MILGSGDVVQFLLQSCLLKILVLAILKRSSGATNERLLVQAEGDGETLQSVELTRGNDHKKHHTKKPSYADGSPITASGKKKTETARGDAEGSAAAATDVQLPSDTKKKKKGKKKTVSGAVENADSIENAESHHQTSGSSRTRKPTLLLCDNAAAVALGNLVAIQVGSRGQCLRSFLYDLQGWIVSANFRN